MFHVPELARDTTHRILRTTSTDGNNGHFVVESPEPGWQLSLICSDCTDPVAVASGWPRWEHVSVSARNSKTARTPTWKEMCYVKRLCWDPEDVVMQLHPKESEYVNCHPHVLHLWRPLDAEIPTPPSVFVGPKT